MAHRMVLFTTPFKKHIYALNFTIFYFNQVRENGVMCSAMEGDNECETAYVRFKCFNNGIPRYLRNMLRDLELYLF